MMENKEFHTILNFNSCSLLRDKCGISFGHIKHELVRPKEKNEVIFNKYFTIRSCGIFLEHWKYDDRYYTQVIMREHGKTKLGDPHISKIPIYQEDINRNKYLKEVILKKFKHLEVEKIDSFLYMIFQKCQDDDLKKYLYKKLEPKIEDSSNDASSNVASSNVASSNVASSNDTNKGLLVYPTTHLKCFNDLFEATGLIGDEYKPILKSVWYCLVSTLIAKNQLELGNIVVDGRINLMISLPSGSGKTEIKKTMKQILNKVGKDYVEPTSFHPEQFVGKVVITNKKSERGFLPIKGYLANDFVMIDEGKDLLTSNDSNYSESRKYLRLAMDSYPLNTITKKSVDIEQANALSYNPHCCACVLVQPFHLQEEIVLAGDFRRFIISYISKGRIDKTESYRSRIRGQRNYKDSINTFYNFLHSITIPESFKLTDEAVNSFEELSILLIKRGSNQSLKVKNFVNIMDFTIQNMLLKFCTIQALQYNTNLIEPKHVELAFVDYAEILEHTYSFIDNKILGNLDYGENWNGAIKNDQEILKWLHKIGAISLETSKVSIKDYKEKIMDLYNVNERQARRHKARHEESGWIKSKKGQHDSKVWLDFEPEKESSSDVREDRVDIEFKDKYMEIVNKIR